MRTSVSVAAVALLLTLTACSSDQPDAAPSSTPTASNTWPGGMSPAPDTPDEDAEEEFEKSLDDLDKALGETIGVQEGTYEVTDSPPEYDDPSLALDDEYIATGTYTTKGPASPGADCYWARMREASGETESIIANDLAAGRAIVTLEEGEFFKTSGCKPWTRKGD